MESAMRRAVLGSIGAMLAAAPLSLAADPPVLPPAIAADLPAAALPGFAVPGQLPPTADAKPTDPATPPVAGPAQPAQSPAQSSNQCSPAAEPKGKWVDTHVGPCEEIWLDAGYRLWWVKDARVTGPLVSPGTSPLFSGGEVAYPSFNGLEVDGGLWLDCRHTLGLEVGGFYFGRQDVSASAASDGALGSPAIVRPFIDAVSNPPTPTTISVSAPGFMAGAITVRTTSELAGFNFNGVKNLSNCENYTVDYLLGFRYIDLEERLNVAQTSNPLPGGALALGGVPLAPGVGISLNDDFHTRNQFYGGMVGTRGELRMGPAFVDLTSTVSFGPNHEILEIYGTTTAVPGGPTQPGGLLAVGGGGGLVPGTNTTPLQPPTYVQQANIGRFTTNRFVVAPEVGLQAGVYVTSHVKLSIGYNFLYMTDVIRPGTQPDLQINTRYVPASNMFGTTSGPPVPAVTGTHEDFHAQGVTFSAEVKY
jgi:hypothetical protein